MPGTRTTVTRATDSDNEGRVVNLVRQAWFQLVNPALLTLIFTVGCWYFSGVNAKLETMSQLLGKLDKSNDLLDARVKSLEDTRQNRTAEIGLMHKDIGDLQLQVGLLRAGVRNGPQEQR